MPDSVKFNIKLVKWSLDYDSSDSNDLISTPIVLQDKNGPCPLIALINTLMLSNDLNLSRSDYIPSNQAKSDAILHFKSVLLQHESVAIELDLLLKHLGDLLLEFTQDNKSGLRFEIDQLLNSLPLLHTGLTVNPNLINGEFNPEDLSTSLFTVFDLKFRHGWVINQIDNENIEWNEEAAPQEGSSSSHADNYAQVVELFNELQTFDRIQDYLLLDSTKDPKLAHNQTLIHKWLDLNRTQLTRIGLDKLNLCLVNEQFVVLFRNNHFSTMFKKSDKEFYVLITDTSFQTSKSSSKIIWQSLNSISGNDDLFFTGDFLPVLNVDQEPQEQYDTDYLLTKQLQEEEDEALAKRMQQSYDKKLVKSENQAKEQKTPTPAPKPIAKDAPKKKKKKSVCVIV
ncbi:uncharacterized protein SPAPADRAFT_60278 [Spathaspora passalidarum NRRL Y-27907]|uniref:MINDY deubiquitinase domain-containing protein n=1 Tax=Spathaspora passalidarum (strain NRRL Y-27907 / 11-Y1) TaxID=619300 RepID=G3AKI1_SPAPN|nr:uncharacterized protein SPAPADRAFT_60278 [Spathaspora passalidarum NRRL Y-27907]EGW32937.1 hypothetical protein SPAPADRAFT_60278 [Spathaspora passalidarum NRRL Y-27907]